VTKLTGIEFSVLAVFVTIRGCFRYLMDGFVGGKAFFCIGWTALKTS